MQYDGKAPPYFRGDASDKYSVDEWEELMDVYLKKKGVPLAEHHQEITSKLMGKARDIVKITLRNNPSLKPHENPKAIISILKQHFSEMLYSSMPLADFYCTVPVTGENAVEYWIRLNKAVDVADECLKREGRRVEEPSREVTRMFVKHCPDPSLAAVLKFKSADKWTASEIQERLDDYQAEMKAQSLTKPRRLPVKPVTAHAQTTTPDDVATTSCPIVPPARAEVMAMPPTQFDGNSMQALVRLLDRALSQNSQAAVRGQHLSDPVQRRPCRTLRSDEDPEQLYVNACTAVPEGVTVVMQNTQKIQPFSELFYAPVIVNSQFQLKGMLDSGSMACTFSEVAEQKMQEENILSESKPIETQVVLIGCGGKQTKPKCAYEVELQVYGVKCVVPVLVVPGQHDDLILGTNVLKHIMHQMKNSDEYWRLISNGSPQSSPECAQFLDVMASVSRWRGEETPSKVGTVKLTQAVTVLARQEHLVWGRLPSNVPMSLGSTVVVEPTSSKSMPGNIMVGRVVTPLWGDRWIPMKITNLSDKPITLKRNCKLADVSPCLAAEDFEVFQSFSHAEKVAQEKQPTTDHRSTDLKQRLHDVGLSQVDMGSWSASHTAKEQLVQLLENYNDVFSKHALDCGKAEGFVHRIRLTDDRPFRLPYRRVPPAHYQKLRQVLTEMEEQGIIRKSTTKLAPYTFDLRHIAGTKNIVADALSRDPFATTISHRLITEPYDCLLAAADEVREDGVQDTFRLKVQYHQVKKTTDIVTTQSDPLPLNCNTATVRALLDVHDHWDVATESRAAQLVQSLLHLAPPGQDPLPVFSLEELQKSQEMDPVISKIVPFVNRRRRPSRREKAGFDAKLLVLVRQWERLRIQDGVLYRVTKDPLSRQKKHQYVMPQSLQEKALCGIHDLAGHQGQARTLHLARQRFFWPKMDRDVKEYVKCCQRCILAKTPEPSARAPLENIRTSAPMELVCLDFWSAEDSKQRSVDVLVLTDHFTKLAHAFPCANQTAKQVAKKVWDHVFCVYGFPERIHTDQGSNFESELIAELLKLSGVSKSHTTSYHPMGNGGTERFNRTLGSMIRALPLRTKQQWPQQIQTLTFAYNATVHETTGFAPFQLMFGRVPRLPIDVMFKQVLRDPVVVDHGSYVKTLMSHLHEAASIAQKHTVKEQRKQAKGYNKRVKGSYLNIGNRVLLANKGERGKKKLADKWEGTVYTVKDRNSQTHIYKLEDDRGRTKVVHRNLILDISFLPVGSPKNSQCSGTLSSIGSEIESRTEDNIDSLELDDSEDRTSAWVLSGSGGTECQESSLDGESQSSQDQLSQNAEEFRCGRRTDEDRESVSSRKQQTDKQTDSDSLAVIPDDELSVIRDRPAHVVDTDQHTLVDASGATHVARTRAGRVVKRVNRLIETMAQKPFSIQGLADTFTKKSQSLLSLF
ncbi:hypothetical protein SKAU_G00342150 [Synaphobranchus kaupii]|uniref:Gypsy retrotransposon integrase-like protein 1 n=1 Tax=Synaphobranchus kaupii TaxID=118154 RepID=A0A9Q1IJM8_SYNKA|nr:hypothetical protein SKAU_G00342150 [Synaphobranchus kaupii]